MRSLLLAVLVLVAVLAPGRAFAQNGGVNGQSRAFDCRDKLRRGLANSATGWVELPYRVFADTVFGNRSPFEGLFIGLAVGTAKSVQRTAVGVFETATFLIPSYEPILDPEYVTLSFEPSTAKKEPQDPRAGLRVGQPQLGPPEPVHPKP
ncbi:MAG: exosortase system-associated protein, TIGR04073 family [Candidatus Omnitrophica bacterium]|nr:exosortase system-associated protein, TIGR04073 family [Candidatus Omnitrophota bacterium]